MMLHAKVCHKIVYIPTYYYISLTSQHSPRTRLAPMVLANNVVEGPTKKREFQGSLAGAYYSLCSRVIIICPWLLWGACLDRIITNKCM